MYLHHIFIDIGQGSSFKENPIYVDCYEKNKLMLENTEFKIKIWNENEIDKLVKEKYPEYLQFIDSFPNPFYKIDFVRPLILHAEGGFYMDLDNYLLEVPDLNKDYIIGNWKNLINNDIIYFKNKDIYLEYVDFMIRRSEDCKMPDSWKVRRFLYSVGARCFNQFCKRKGFINRDKNLYVNILTASWLKSFDKKKI